MTVATETAFLAGLLHHIGKIVLLRYLVTLPADDPARVATLREPTLIEFLDALHCRVGDVLCAAWNIPLDLRAVVLRHHETELQAPKDLLIAVVQVANLMAAKIGVSSHSDRNISLLDTAGSNLLRLDDVKLASLLIELEDDWHAIEGVL